MDAGDWSSGETPGMKAPLEVVPRTGNTVCPSIDLRCLPVLLIQSDFFCRNTVYKSLQYPCGAAAVLDKFNGGDDCQSVNLLSCRFYSPWCWPLAFRPRS